MECRSENAKGTSDGPSESNDLLRVRVKTWHIGFVAAFQGAHCDEEAYGAEGSVGWGLRLGSVFSWAVGGGCGWLVGGGRSGTLIFELMKLHQLLVLKLQ